ncbi:MAG TPA: dehydrogenase [Clostridiales bacterium]|nr:MAG: hypothetical protein A2Y22_02130 [Clostridiales bacterium GWD2_32_59]HAN10313.1 dehydrogenase [Clostridiales bacterium]
MKVAIIGAGISGLACAFEFERNGIIPTIFEKKSNPGDTFDLNICMFNTTGKSYRDPLVYLKKQYNIELNPLSHLNKVTLNTPDKQTILVDNFGYIFKRGIEEYSLGSQLASKIKCPITSDTYIHNTKDLSNNFDYIVVATGNNNIAKSLNIWNYELSTRIRIATILGKFETGSLILWFDKRFAKDCYGYMIAHSPKEAILTLIVNNISYSEMEYYFKEFLLFTKLNYKINGITELDFYTGFINTMQIGNTYFIGNSGGLVEDFLGYGVMNSIESGVLAARSIINNKNYNIAIQPLINDVNHFVEFRNKLSDSKNDVYSTEAFISRLPGLKSSYHYCESQETKVPEVQIKQ